MKLLGVSFRGDIAIVCLIIGAILGCHLLCSCSKAHVKEAFGAALNYDMGLGVPGDNGRFHKLPSIAQKLETHSGSKVPLPEGQLFYFYNTEFKPECCVPPFSGVSSADGCACVTKEQVDYINMRGGNRTCCSEF